MICILDTVYEKVRSHLLEDEMVVDGRVPDVGERRKVPLARDGLLALTQSPPLLELWCFSAD